jgi:hypothetical protein
MTRNCDPKKIMRLRCWYPPARISRREQPAAGSPSAGTMSAAPTLRFDFVQALITVSKLFICSGLGKARKGGLPMAQGLHASWTNPRQRGSVSCLPEVRSKRGARQAGRPVL